MTGLTRHQVIGRTWHEVYGRQFADLYREMDRRAIADGHQIERPRDVMLRADGRTLIVNQRVVPVFDGAQAEQQSASYVMSIVDDLTDEVRAETALRRDRNALSPVCREHRSAGVHRQCRPDPCAVRSIRAMRNWSGRRRRS